MFLLTIGLLFGLVILLWCLVLTVTCADSTRAGQIVATPDGKQNRHDPARAPPEHDGV